MKKIGLMVLVTGWLMAVGVKAADNVVEITGVADWTVNSITEWVDNYLDSQYSPGVNVDYVGRVFNHDGTVNGLTATGIGTDEGTFSYDGNDLIAVVIGQRGSPGGWLLYNNDLEPFQPNTDHIWISPETEGISFVSGFTGSAATVPEGGSTLIMSILGFSGIVGWMRRQNRGWG